MTIMQELGCISHGLERNTPQRLVMIRIWKRHMDCLTPTTMIVQTTNLLISFLQMLPSIDVSFLHCTYISVLSSKAHDAPEPS